MEPETQIHPATPNFKWREALLLQHPQWQIVVWPDPWLKDNIIKTALKMQMIRDFLGKPCRITSWYRPKIYNMVIGGASNSYHMLGLACDFHVPGMDASITRTSLLTKLDDFEIRMEDLPGANWVHIDLGEPRKQGRYFRPEK